MKKYLFIISFCGLCITASGQKRQTIITAGKWANKSVTVNRSATLINNEMPVRIADPTTSVSHKIILGHNYANNTSNETIVGNTDYDVQTNASIYPRIVKNIDGTISAVWLFYADGAATVTGGTAYNYFDGTNWASLQGTSIDSPRVKYFPSIVITSSGQEACFTSSQADSTILFMHRAMKGTGTWTFNSTSLKSGGIGNTDR